jgi:hypothetical protein
MNLIANIKINRFRQNKYKKSINLKIKLIKSRIKILLKIQLKPVLARTDIRIICPPIIKCTLKKTVLEDSSEICMHIWLKMKFFLKKV